MIALEQRLTKLVGLCGVLVTLMVTPWSSFDPINLGKVLVLATLSFGIFGILWGQPRIFLRLPRKYLVIFAFLLLALLIPLLFADSPFSLQFWGIFGRNTGFLTYFSLIILALGASLLRNSISIQKILNWLVYTNFVVTAYCAFQFVGIDPIKWSQQGVFATLGNVNFLSAFLGISSIPLLSKMLNKESPLLRRCLYLFVAIVDLLLIVSTDSIQGVICFGVGFVVLAFNVLRRSSKSRLLLPIATLGVGGAAIATGSGLLNKGPLSSLLYQDSTVFRGDYMLAAIKMLQRFPFTGVGLDSYDGWYRRVRGFISAYRTGPSRSSNSAHNIVLDLAAGGGLILLASYLILLLIVVWCGWRTINNAKQTTSTDITLFATWLAYQVQTLVSINQVAVGVWGWILNGLVISNFFIKQSANLANSSQSKPTKPSSKKITPITTQVSPTSAILGITFASFGFLLAYLPFNADVQFRNSYQRGDLAGLMKVAQMPAISAFHLSKTLEVVARDQHMAEATSISARLVDKFPADPFGWSVRASLSSLSREDQDFARAQIRKHDPWFACFDQNPDQTILNWYQGLTTKQKWELLRWWEVSKNSQESEERLAALEKSDKFSKRISGYCSGS